MSRVASNWPTRNHLASGHFRARASETKYNRISREIYRERRRTITKSNHILVNSGQMLEERKKRADEKSKLPANGEAVTSQQQKGATIRALNWRVSLYPVRGKTSIPASLQDATLSDATGIIPSTTTSGARPSP
ncbi:hypothetical protein RRG08_021425 [Elysia crispata]|uniref:Uncharacterized protein n=1 Tax=Elysia crispata TaxID=231223 RepID=A0AAE1A5M7_9GAST|nr:hypothetical protein RRG08_021425 [Elysia crispata]